MPEAFDTAEQDIMPAGNGGPSLEHTGTSDEELLAAHVAQLRHQIEEANYQYFVKDNPTLSDAEYDQLMIELRRIEQEHPELQSPDSPTQRRACVPRTRRSRGDFALCWLARSTPRRIESSGAPRLRWM